jgi:membrane-associated phospholipid phosphatase
MADVARRFRLRLRRPRFRGVSTPVVTVRHSVRRLALVAVTSALLVVLLYVVAVQTPLGQSLEELVLWGRPIGDPEAIELAWRALGTLNLAVAAVATIGLAGIAVALGRPALAAGVVVAVAGSNLTTQLLKSAILDRPNLVGSDAYAFGNSFPSGHVTLAASLALAALLVAPRRLRSLVALAGAAYVAVVGISTLTTGWHRLADGLGAILVALAWTSLVAAIVAATRGTMPRRSWSGGTGRAGTRLLAASALGLFAAALGVLTYAWLTRAAEGSLAEVLDAPEAYLAALAVLAAGALAAAASLLWALRGVTLESRAPVAEPAG